MEGVVKEVIDKIMSKVMEKVIRMGFVRNN
jgi:hypothetical protein